MMDSLCLPLLAMSLDLNPIKHVWDDLQTSLIHKWHALPNSLNQHDIARLYETLNHNTEAITNVLKAVYNKNQKNCPIVCI